MTTVKDPNDAMKLAQQITELLGKEATEPVEWSARLSGFYSIYNIIPKKDGGVQPILDLRELSQFLKVFAISHATHIGCPSSNQPTAMVHHDRSEGCLLSCANRTTTQTISPLCILRSGLPVSRTTIWPVSVPASVHEVYVGSIISNSSSGGTVTPLSGRLAPVRTISGASNRTDQSSDLSCDTIGPQGELQQKPISSMSVGEVHRYTTGLEVDESLTVTSESGRHFAPPSTFLEACQASIQMCAQVDGHVSSGSDGDSTGSALAAPLSEIGEQSAPEPHMAQEKTSKNYRKMPSYLETMEEEIISDERGSAGGDSVSPRSSSNRYVTDWVGSSVATQSDQGKLEFRSSIEKHTYFGVESGAASSGVLWNGIAESPCSYKDRQYFSGISYQSSGRHEVQSLAEVDMGHSDVGFPLIGKHQSDVCTGGFECGGRFLVPSQTLTGRVEA